MKTVSKKLLSILLVAILLVSAVPMAFAEAHDSFNPAHTLVLKSNQVGHWKECPSETCDAHISGQMFDAAMHNYDKSTHKCTVCGFDACPHTNYSVQNAVAATCVKPGYQGDMVCNDCGASLAGSATPATGVHNYNASNVCVDCGATKIGAPATLTLDANGGTINGAASIQVSVTEGNPISVLPDPYRQGFTFAGWFINGTQVYVASNYNFVGNQTAVARWAEQTYPLTVRMIKNGNMSTATTIATVNVPAGTPLLNYLNTNVYGQIQTALAQNPGFTWENNYWRDFSGNLPLTSQADVMNQAQTIFVNFKSNAYTLYFNPNGGVVTPTSKPVYFGAAVGTLPVANMNGKVFKGWKDANGQYYTESTVYQVAGDTSLTAVWENEAKVILHVYINGDFSGSNRMISMDGFVKNNNVSRADVVAQVQKYYSAANGYLNIAGLFDDYTWGSYRANTSKPGVDNIQVTGNGTTNIYVMVTNATTGNTVVNGNISSSNTNSSNTVNGYVPNATWVSTGNGTGYWYYPNGTTTNSSTNPKTGDEAMIEAAAAVMVLAAAALVTVFEMRKRKMI